LSLIQTVSTIDDSAKNRPYSCIFAFLTVLMILAEAASRVSTANFPERAGRF
jgi:hypothetical protein